MRQIPIILLTLLLIPAYSLAEINIPLQKELFEIKIEDQKVRKWTMEPGFNTNNPPKELVAEMVKVDEKNTARLKAIIKEHSWPTKDLVGVEGMAAIFLIIQHSSDHAFQEQLLPSLKKSYLNGDGITGQQVALLTDRVLIHQGKKQRYGTQVDIIDSGVVFKPIKDKTNVDKRRKEMGMPSLVVYTKIIEELYNVTDHPEIDLIKD